MIQEPSLIVTLLISQAQAEPAASLIEHLARARTEGGLALVPHSNGGWQNEESRTLLISWSHQEMPEIRVVQLALNEKGLGVEGWRRARERYHQAMAGLPVHVQEAVQGCTLIYQALVQQPPAQVVATLWEQGVLTTEGGLPLHHPLAAALDAPGGAVWLLATPGGEQKEAIYLALGPEDGQETLVFDVLFGEKAALPGPDSILHQAYHLSAPYLASRRDRVLRALDDLQTRSVALLTQSGSPPDQELQDFRRGIASLSTILAEIQRLDNALDVLAMNHDRMLVTWPWMKDIGRYQRLRLDAMLQQVSHDAREIQSVLDGAQVALQSLETEFASRRAAAQERTNLILVVVGLILALLQVIDADAPTMRWRLLVVVFILAAFIAGWLVWRRKG